MSRDDEVSPLSPTDRIDILLKEYESLRSECLQRGAAGFAIWTALVSVVTWFIARWHGWKTTIELIFVIPIIAFALFLNWGATLYCSARIKEIESDVNIRANERLLVWESFWAAGSRGMRRDICDRIRRRTNPPLIPPWKP